MVDEISREGLRILLREEGVSFQRLKTWKTSRDPDYAAKKARVEHLYAIADGEVMPGEGEPEVIFCMDESGPLNLMPHPGRQWAERGGRHKDQGREPRRRRRATYNRYGGVRHLFAALDLAKDKLYGHIKLIKRRTQFLEFCRYLRRLYPPTVRIAIVCDNFSPHLTTKKCQRVGAWAAANNVEIAYTPTDSSWLNRIEAQFAALRCFTLDSTDHATHKEQGSMRVAARLGLGVSEVGRLPHEDVVRPAVFGGRVRLPFSLVDGAAGMWWSRSAVVTKEPGPWALARW